MEMGKSIPTWLMFLLAAIGFIMLYYALYGGINNNYIDCYMERGTMIDNWIDDGDLHIKLISGRTIWFEDDTGENVDFTKKHIDLRWCYIEELNAYRVRGVWTW